MEVLWAWIILGLGGYIVYRRYSKDGDWRKYSRKQIIILIMMVDLIGWIRKFTISLHLLWVVIREPATLLPGVLSPIHLLLFHHLLFWEEIHSTRNAQHEIGSGRPRHRPHYSTQALEAILYWPLFLFHDHLRDDLRLIFRPGKQIRQIWLLQWYLLFAIALAEFFNIVTTVGFFMQGLFILQVKQLSR